MDGLRNPLFALRRCRCRFRSRSRCRFRSRCRCRFRSRCRCRFRSRCPRSCRRPRLCAHSAQGSVYGVRWLATAFARTHLLPAPQPRLASASSREPPLALAVSVAVALGVAVAPASAPIAPKEAYMECGGLPPLLPALIYYPRPSRGLPRHPPSKPPLAVSVAVAQRRQVLSVSPWLILSERTHPALS
jgi:hypothetical protein